MNFFSQILDALKFTLRDWKAIVLLGLILCILSTSKEYQSDSLLIYYIICIIWTALVLVEE